MNKPARERSRSDLLIGLMGSTGLLMLPSAAPVGLIVGLNFYYKAHFDLRVAILGAAALTATILVLGGILLRACIYFSKRRRNDLTGARVK